jgi:hypothetical protein
MGEERACNGVDVFHKQFQSCIIKVVYNAVHKEVKHIEVWKEERQTASQNRATTRARGQESCRVSWKPYVGKEVRGYIRGA